MHLHRFYCFALSKINAQIKPCNTIAEVYFRNNVATNNQIGSQRAFICVVSAENGSSEGMCRYKGNEPSQANYPHFPFSLFYLCFVFSFSFLLTFSFNFLLDVLSRAYRYFFIPSFFLFCVVIARLILRLYI